MRVASFRNYRSIFALSERRHWARCINTKCFHRLGLFRGLARAASAPHGDDSTYAGLFFHNPLKPIARRERALGLC